MSTYVCIVFGVEPDVLRMDAFESPGDGSACSRAMALQRSMAASTAFELWRDGRKISAYYGRGKHPLHADRQPAAEFSHWRRAP